MRTATLAMAMFTTFAMLVGAPTANAAAELTVSPLIMELDATAGDVLTEPISISATGDEAITVELVHADFGFDDDYQVVLINDDAEETTAFSTRDWFSLPQKRYRIPAGTSRSLPLRIEVPENTPGGTYLGAALLRIVPPKSDAGGSQVQAVPQSGPLVFIAVEGGDPPKAVVDRFVVPKLQSSGPIKPELVVGNDGDEFFTIEGTVMLTGPGKDQVVEVRRQFVVPNEPREVLAAAADGASDEGALRLGSSKLDFGRYTVTTRLRVEPTGTTLVSSRKVWVVPTWVWLLGIGMLVVLVALVVLIVRRIRDARADRSLDAEREAAHTPVIADDDAEDDELEDDDDADDLSDDELDDIDEEDEDELDELADEDEDSVDLIR